MSKPSQKYLLLSDVVGSRKITDRRGFEKKLHGVLKKLNKEKTELFEIPIKIWKGLDETAAILKKPALVYSLVDEINDAIAPEQMRFVLVKGAVDSMPANGDIAGTVGDVFHKAAARMGVLKRDGFLLACDTGNSLRDTALQTQVNLLQLLKSGWTQQQRQVYRLYTQTVSQEAVAKKLAISQQAVSKSLKAVAAGQVQVLEKEVLRWCAGELSST